jgi:exonuclease SbcC
MPAAEELRTLLAARLTIDEVLAAARQTEDLAKAAAAVSTTEVARLEGDEQSAWETFQARRDQAARLAPPPASGSDLLAAWSRLVDWAADEAGRQREALEALVAEADEAMAAQSAAEDQVSETLAAAGVVGEGSPTARLAGAVATARADHAKAQERRVEREAVESDLVEFEDAAGLARGLAVHMRANNFEGWLLAEALASLVSGANGLLADLSRGAYSLILQNGKIEVVDHRNADEHRSVRSLSGGETFLVSLALALSLGEQLVNLSERGGARLDAIFLDEGFGSLDAETLDTVTAVVTELASQGRVVGLVTHVRELGDQVPVRFVVRPGPGGSTIERVDGAP